MNIVIIVNIIAALAILTGGLMMRKYADEPVDRSIGFRTQKAMSDSEAWRFANKKCGGAWAIIGAVCFVLTLAAVLAFPAHSFAHLAVLILLTVSAVTAAVFVEIQLKSRSGKT